jgi:chromosome segregation ATPase
MATVDELTNKTRYLESEIEGEKAVTRHIFESTRRHAEELAALRVEIATLRLVNERIGGDVAMVKAAQVSQGSMLNILVQDVGALRNETAALRHELRTETAALNRRFDGLETRFGRLETRFDGLETRFDGLERNVAAILAAVSRGNQPHA